MNSSDKNHIKDTYLAKWLSGEISKKELESFISKNEIEDYIKINKGVDLFIPPSFDEVALLKKLSNKIKPTKTKIRTLSYRWLYVAASVSAIVIFSYLFYYLNPTVIKTKPKEYQNITLMDDSKVRVNSGSNLSYSRKAWKTKRQITLEGEAYFEVKKGDNFSVITKQGMITVIGTKFNINVRDDFLNVKCFEGKVRVTKDADTLFLTQGMAIQYYNAEKEQWKFEDKTPHWLIGESTFRKVPLKIVIRSLENQFGLKIIADKIEDTRLYSGSFMNDNLNIALKSVFFPMGIDYEIKNKTIFLSKK